MSATTEGTTQRMARAPAKPDFDEERMLGAEFLALDAIEGHVSKIEAASFFIMNNEQDPDTAGLGWIIRDLAHACQEHFKTLRRADVVRRQKG